jgi:predicted permease
VTDRGANSVPDYFDRRKLKEVFTEVAEFGNSGWDAGTGTSAQRVEGAGVTPSFFHVLSAKPKLGRVFTEEEGAKGKDQVVVLSDGLWTDMFGRDPEVLGKELRLSGLQYKIVGVMAADFQLPGGHDRLWVPLSFTPEQMSDDSRHSNNWQMIGRLAPGVTLQRAQARIDALNAENKQRFPQYRALLESARFGTKVLSIKDEVVRDVRPVLYLLQVAVGVVLLIGCVNLANLMLVRSNVRMKELAIRFSMGAGRWRIGRQLLTESVTLALAGGALGILIGWAGIRALATLGAADLPRGATIGVNPAVLGFTALVAVVTGIAFGAAPLVHVLRRDLNEIFRGNERSGTAGHHALWVRAALVVCQFALAFVLLIGSGLLTMSFSRVLSVKAGFDPDNVISARVSLPRNRYGEDNAQRAFFSNLLDKIRAVPGVKTASVTTYLPFGGSQNASVVTVVGRTLAPGENPPVPGWNIVDHGYFSAMGIRLVQGRLLTPADGTGAPKVAVIDEYLARRFWPNGDAIGSKVRRGVGARSDEIQWTVVGIVGSVKTTDLADQTSMGQIYFDFRQFPARSMHVVAKTAREDPSIVQAVRREVAQADPELALFDVKTMPERIAASLVNRRAAMVLCLMFAALALLLAAIGIYGVLAYSVSERTRELGIRVALGASARDVLSMVVGRGLQLATIGLAVGAGVAVILTRLMTTMLYDVKPTDPAVFLLVAIVLGIVAVLASLIPSVRALRIRPATALRYE